MSADDLQRMAEMLRRLEGTVTELTNRDARHENEARAAALRLQAMEDDLEVAAGTGKDPDEEAGELFGGKFDDGRFHQGHQNQMGEEVRKQARKPARNQVGKISRATSRGKPNAKQSKTRGKPEENQRKTTGKPSEKT